MVLLFFAPENDEKRDVNRDMEDDGPALLRLSRVDVVRGKLVCNVRFAVASVDIDAETVDTMYG